MADLDIRTQYEAPGTATPAHPLRVHRVAAGHSQQSLADIAGCARSTIAGLERGEWAPSRIVATALSRALGVEREELFPADRGHT